MGQQLCWSEKLHVIHRISNLCGKFFSWKLWSFLKHTHFWVPGSYQTLTLGLVICTTIVHLVVQANREELSASESLRKGAGSAVAFAMSIIVVWPVAGLLGYHIRVSYTLLAYKRVYKWN